MAAKCSTAPAVLWNLVIEALANFEQVDTSTLIGLVKMAPAISGDLGKDAREMVSLRILESLFVHGNEAIVDTDSAQNAKISFDASECCENVLQQILHETPELMAKLEKGKWDVRPFLMHKRSSLPKCSLKKLKEAILESSHPLLASLKERSKLVIANVSENVSPAIDGNFDVQDTVAKDDLAFLNPRKDKNKFQEKVLQEADQVGNSSGGTAEHTGREECEMFIERPLEGSNGNKLMEHDAHAASETLLQSCDIANAPHDQQQLHCNDDKLPQDTYREGHDKRISVDSMGNLEFVFKSKDNSIQPNTLDGEPSSEAKNSMEHDGRLETSIDSERADDERTDIAAKKVAFLNSQCTLNQDSLAMTEWSEINLCMKCNEGGQLLVCSSDACPLRVHENCLGSAVTLDENGEFFCPFCAYSRAISKYLEAKRKASLARKDLQAFSSITVKRRPNKSAKKRSELEKNEDRQMGAFGETTDGNGDGDTVSRANNINCMSNKEDSALADSLIPVVNDDPSCGEKGAAVTSAENSMLPGPSRSCVNNDLSCGDKGVSVANRSMTEAEEVGQNVSEGCQSPTRMEEHQLPSQAVNDCGLKSPSFNGNESDLVTGEHADMHIQTGCLNQQTTDLPQNPIPQPNTPKQKCKEKESRRSIESSYSRRLRKRKPQYTSPAVPSSRRKILPWTKSEEEILKEGVQRCSSVTNKGIPWTEILDFGRNVFHKGRTPIDLKDKWRNICKGSPNLK